MTANRDDAVHTAVLDTNVWLDWLVFRDPGVEVLKGAVAGSHVKLIHSLPGERELERVLAYKALEPLVGAALRPILMEEMRQASHLHDGSTRAGRLPPCRDADDQPFLELARDCGATWLLSKDRDLLELARAKYRIHTFRIVTPAQWSALWRVPLAASEGLAAPPPSAH